MKVIRQSKYFCSVHKISSVLLHLHIRKNKTKSSCLYGFKSISVIDTFDDINPIDIVNKSLYKKICLDIYITFYVLIWTKTF